MRLGSALISTAFALALAGCGSSTDDADGGAAHIGVRVEIPDMPMVTIDDELGTDVRVFVELDHFGGPTAETFEVVSAGLRLDLEPYVDLELAIPAEHPPFPGLADGEQLDLELRGHLPDTHADWGLCADPQAEQDDGSRVSLDLVLRLTPGANDEADEHVFESRAVTLHCSHTG